MAKRRKRKKAKRSSGKSCKAICRKKCGSGSRRKGRKSARSSKRSSGRGNVRKGWTRGAEESDRDGGGNVSRRAHRRSVSDAIRLIVSHDCLRVACNRDSRAYREMGCYKSTGLSMEVNAATSGC